MIESHVPALLQEFLFLFLCIDAKIKPNIPRINPENEPNTRVIGKTTDKIPKITESIPNELSDFEVSTSFGILILMK